MRLSVEYPIYSCVGCIRVRYQQYYLMMSARWESPLRISLWWPFCCTTRIPYFHPWRLHGNPIRISLRHLLGVCSHRASCTPLWYPKVLLSGSSEVRGGGNVWYSRTDAFSSVTVCIWEIRDGCSPGNWFKCLVGRRGCRRAFNQRSFKLKCWLNLWLNRQSYGTPGWSKVSYFEFCLSKFSISW